jgi:hypothetical protein
VHDGFRVAAVAELVAECGQLGADRFKIVDLAVEDDGDTAVLVIHRLVATLRVDHRQPAVAQRDAGGEVEAVAVRAAMGNGVGHGPDGLDGGGRPVALGEESCQAAHARSSDGVCRGPA